MTKKSVTSLVITAVILLLNTTIAQGAEVFAKASLSKSNFSQAEYETSFSGSAGLAFGLFSTVKLEARYIFRYSERNLILYDSSTHFDNYKTAKNIYTLGLSIDIVSDKNPVQPYIYLGGGYITSESKFDYVSNGTTRAGSTYTTQPSANGGLGIRMRIGRSVGFELEGFAYATDIDKPGALVDWFLSAGLRFFL